MPFAVYRTMWNPSQFRTVLMLSHADSIYKSGHLGSELIRLHLLLLHQQRINIAIIAMFFANSILDSSSTPIFLFLICALWLSVYRRIQHRTPKLALPPGPPAHWLFGNRMPDSLWAVLLSFPCIISEANTFLWPVHIVNLKNGQKNMDLSSLYVKDVIHLLSLVGKMSVLRCIAPYCHRSTDSYLRLHWRLWRKKADR